MTTTAPSMSSPTSSICDHCLESNLEFYEPSRDCEAAARVLVICSGTSLQTWTLCWSAISKSVLSGRWDGNADIVGVGMMVVYAMGAILSTMYLITFIHGMLRENNYQSFKAPQIPPQNGILDAIRNMFYHSFGAFHSGLGLLTASVLVATLIIAGQKESVYDIETSFLCSATLTAMFFLTLPAYLDIEQ
ncbi:hypothetical protein HYQ44_008577 [Verticillium longisporum]|nr:hypothetical protein HYQ44_008577 [Verticillium longisporum]